MNTDKFYPEDSIRHYLRIFDNGYGASIIKRNDCYFDLFIIKHGGTGRNWRWEVDKSTTITFNHGGQRTHLTVDEVNNILTEIKTLPPKKFH